MHLGARLFCRREQRLSAGVPPRRLIIGSRRAGHARCLVLFLALGGPVAWADSPLKGSLEIAAGHEELTSPLVRVAPSGPLLRVEGLNRLAGSSLRINGSVLRDWTLDGGTGISASARGDVLRAPAAPDLDWGIAAADVMLRHPWAGATWGIGPSVQRLWVARRRFRDTVGVQADALRVDGSGHWSLAGDWAQTQHSGENSDFNSAIALVSLQRRISDPLPGLESMDLEGGLLRERNRAGLPELGSRSAYLRVTLAGKRWGYDWSLGGMTQRSRFDATVLDPLPARRDRFRSLDLSVSRDIGEGAYVKAEANFARNEANSPLFESRYRQVALTLGFAW